MAAARNKFGLTARQEAFAVNYACKGMTKTEAYRLAYPDQKMSQKDVWDSASKLSFKPVVIQRIDDLLSEMQVDDIVSSQKILKRMEIVAETAAESGQLGVAMQANDRLMRHKALLSDRIITSREGAGHDTDIVAALAGGDPRKERQLRAIIGSDEGFAPLEVVDNALTEDSEPEKEPDKSTG